MRWRGRERSDNVEDRRGMSPGKVLGGGGGMLALIVVFVLKYMGAGQGVQQMVGQAVNNIQEQRAQQVPAGEGMDDDHREFCQVVLADTEKVWPEIFRTQLLDRVEYIPPKLVMFPGSTDTACGQGQAAMGPFYCPADQKIYIDPTFFDDLARRHKAPGDFAQAYVLAHEVAHHVQKLLGFSDAMHKVRMKGDKLETNRASVRLELQADYLAGVWANHAHRTFDILEEGDMEEAINAANRIGDDTLQREATGRVDVHSFTHGSSAQRVRWFKEGLLSGDLVKAKLIWNGIDFNEL